jgi:hypothetical protein
LKKYKYPGSGPIPFELIEEGGEILVFGIHKLINSIWNKVELHEQRKESVIVSTHKKGDKTGCNNYREISLQSSSYNIFLNIRLSSLSPYIVEINWDHYCDFRRNSSTTDHIILHSSDAGEKNIVH